MKELCVHHGLSTLGYDFDEVVNMPCAGGVETDDAGKVPAEALVYTGECECSGMEGPGQTADVHRQG